MERPIFKNYLPPLHNVFSPRGAFESNRKISSIASHLRIVEALGASPHRTRFTSTKIVELTEMWNSQNSEKGESRLFQEFLQSINQPSLESEVQQSFFNAPVTFDQNKFAGQNAGHGGNEKAASSSAQVQKVTTMWKEPVRIGNFKEGDQEKTSFPVCHKQEVEHQTLPTRSDITLDGEQNDTEDAMEILKRALADCSPPPFFLDAYRDTVGPIFDIPFFLGDTGSSSSLSSVNYSSNLSLAYGIEDTENLIGKKRKEKVCRVSSLKDASRMTAQRKENKLFDQMGEKLNWTKETTGYDQVPKWFQARSGEVNAPAAHLSNKVLHNNLPSANFNFRSKETVPDMSLRAERGSAPLKTLSRGKKALTYREANDKNGNPFGTSSQEKFLGEKRQNVNCENENFNHIVVGPRRNENQLEGGGSFCNRDNEDHHPLKRARNYITSQEAGCSDPLLATQKSVRIASPAIPSQKFSSPSAADARSNFALEGKAAELAEGEIAVPGADPQFPVSPNAGCLNSTSADAEDIAIDATEPSRGSRGITSLYTRRPIISETKMSATIQKKCKSVVNELQRRINEEGQYPHLAYLCKKSAGSCYMINMAGIHLLDFQKIFQRLDEAKYDRIIDFLADIQSMLEGTARQFGFSHEMRSEVIKVQEIFFDMMKTTFPNIDVHDARLVSAEK